jgi:hypothetical protein
VKNNEGEASEAKNNEGEASGVKNNEGEASRDWRRKNKMNWKQKK